MTPGFSDKRQTIFVNQRGEKYLVLEKCYEEFI